MRPLVSLRSALTDPGLLGNVLAGDSWLAWRALLLAIRGEALEPAELECFRKLTGRTVPPSEPVNEFWGIVGRRGGKTRAMSVLAAYLASLCCHRSVLVPGERGVLLLLAPSLHQAKIAFSYVEAAFEQSPILRQQVESASAETLTLRGGIDIQVRAASFRRLRGVTSIAVLADETCFWQSDEASANADTEILDACRPSLATTSGPLVCTSSPYAQRGATFEAWRRHYGPDGDPEILVAQGASRDFNPSLPQSVVDRALERDLSSARAEYLGLFRDDIAEFIRRAALDEVTDVGIVERVPMRQESYVAFCDPSGGASDAMTLAIAHRAGDLAVLDAVREVRAPFDPSAVVSQFAAVLKRYGCTSVTGDAYGAAWVQDAFRKCGISYRHSRDNRTEIYLQALAAINSKQVRLLDNERMRSQFLGLERRTSRAGRDSVDHRSGAHDDLSNSAAGALVLAANTVRMRNTVTTGRVVGLW